VLWTTFEPIPPEGDATARAKRCFIEQRWFSGAHANVGGGYRSDLLPNRPLKWIYDKSVKCGLAFRCAFEITDEDYKTKPVDSYALFLGGLWKVLTFGRRYIRWVQSDPVLKAKGRVRTVNERIDWSIFERWKRDTTYRPASLREWAGRKKLDVTAIVANPGQFERLWAPVSSPGIE